MKTMGKTTYEIIKYMTLDEQWFVHKKCEKKISDNRILIDDDENRSNREYAIGDDSQGNIYQLVRPKMEHLRLFREWDSKQQVMTEKFQIRMKCIHCDDYFSFTNRHWRVW
jgi:hypothetical protein